MRVEYHPLVPRDLREILDWYEERSETAADRFFRDFEQTVESLRQGRTQGSPIDQNCSKLYLSKFPYCLTYEIDGDSIYVFVVKHQKRHPNYGMRRSRPSKNR